MPRPRLVDYNGRRYLLSELSELLGIPYKVLAKRVERGKLAIDAPYKPAPRSRPRPAVSDTRVVRQVSADSACGALKEAAKHDPVSAWLSGRAK